MDIESKKQKEQETKERKHGSYKNLIEANIKLVDKIKWIKEDIKREINKIATNDIPREEIITDLEIIIKNNIDF